MNILVFKTDIDNTHKLASINNFFAQIPEINHWSVDMEDIDNVLRVETSGDILESNIIDLLNKIDVYCQDLA
ncbi:hypothetical protein [Flavivirga rizhaonensis]|uniref:Uncharacterized protein n=1 Tax=Flavivirga rizhaonensis TaxID=2559571 RepID=A0A4S1E090_9FLAO|nr:hypothetical protein [Flavivirga rizhaonensis]TGV04071.1 hypothetical protein EM932_04550 [Flavivirga rizhaonensis]